MLLALTLWERLDDHVDRGLLSDGSLDGPDFARLE